MQMRCRCFYSAVMANSKLDYYVRRQPWNSLTVKNVPLFLAALTIVIASYMAYQRIRFKNCRVQNSAARLVFKESTFCHIAQFLRALRWLPVAYRIALKISSLTFKAIHKLAPIYISELVSLKDTGGRYYLRLNNSKRLNIPP